ncbi:hypothetical protein niasHT_011636 [Heterodera trifolii]|uniref:Uncharacterized protein n=1 Tax=Heterodera trifolii TaxID=157864 RepID=A0ABD2LHX0_9BILA
MLHFLCTADWCLPRRPKPAPLPPMCCDPQHPKQGWAKLRASCFELRKLRVFWASNFELRLRTLSEAFREANLAAYCGKAINSI